MNIKQAGIEERDGVTIYDISFSSPVGDRSAAVGARFEISRAACRDQHEPIVEEARQKRRSKSETGSLARIFPGNVAFQFLNRLCLT